MFSIGKFSYLFVVLAALFIAAVSAAPAEVVKQGPSRGDWAYPPNGWKDEEPGTVLKTRKIVPHELGIFKINATGYQALYRTSGHNSSDPMATIMTVLVPNNASLDKVVIANTPEDAAAYKCGPSTALEHSDLVNFEGIVARFELLLNNLYLQKGYVVVIPDYEGPQAAFGVGTIAGHAVLDSARAARNMNELDLPGDVKFVTIGYSGGAIATGWAVQMHPSYASDVNLVGATLGGTPADLLALIEHIDGTSTAGIIILGAAGLLNGNPEIRDPAYDLMTKDGINAITWASKNCAAISSLPFAFQKIQSKKYLKSGKNMRDIPLFKNLLEPYTMARSDSEGPTAPIYMFHAKTDEIIPYDNAKKTAQSWCQKGANIEFQTQTFPTTHVAAYIATFANMVKFVEARFAGKDFHDGGCEFSTTGSPAFNLDDDIALIGDIVEDVKTLFGEATHEN